MLRNIKKFWKTEFNITECEDEVYEDSDSDQEMNKQDEAGENEVEEDKFDEKQAEEIHLPKTFIFSCLGVNMSNYARKTE